MTIAEHAKAIYETELKAILESTHRDQFVAIEPQSKSYFVDEESINAALAAKQAYPDRKSFLIRIGHPAAFHLGAGAS